VARKRAEVKDVHSVIMTSKSLFLYLPIFLAALSAVEGCCPDCVECWEQCFAPPTASASVAYGHLYNIVTTVRAQRAKFGTRGTLYNFDSTSSIGSEQDYQRKLAALIALTEPVSNECNPFFLAKFAHFFAWQVC